MAVKNFAKKKAQVLANRSTSDQALFKPGHTTKQYFQNAKNGTRKISPAEREKSLTALNDAKKNLSEAQGVINNKYKDSVMDDDKISALRGKRDNLDNFLNERSKNTPNDAFHNAKAKELMGMNKQINEHDRQLYARKNELNGLTDLQGAVKTAQGNLKTGREALGFGGRALEVGKGIGHYFAGGSMKQNLTRSGTAVGGIVGLNMGMDYIDNKMNGY